MAGLAGKPTVVNIWGSWCPPCQAEEKYLSSAYNIDRGKVRLGIEAPRSVPVYRQELLPLNNQGEAPTKSVAVS